MVYWMQNSFAGGEFAPSLDARQDLQRYGTGCRCLKNFYVKPQGAAVNRPGTYFIAETKDSGKCRLIPFVFSDEIAYVLEFGDYYVRFYRDGGQLLADGSPYEVVTPYAAGDVAELKYTQSADVLYLVHPSYAPRTLSRSGDIDWTLALFGFELGPFAPMNLTETTLTPSATNGAIELTASGEVFTAGHVGALFRLDQDIEAQTVSGSLAAAASTSAVTGMGTWLVTTHGEWTGKIYVEKSTDDGVTWKKLREFSSNSEYNIDASGTEDDEIVMLRVRMYDYTSGTCYVDLQFEPYTAYGIVELTAVTSATEAAATVKQALGSSDSTVYWYQGAWSKERGWPGAVVFYQNRLVFANTASEPQTLWASQTGDYTNFGVSVTVEDSDAITTPLVSDKVNAIKSLKSLSRIIGLTAGGYWVIGGGDSAAFTPTTQSASAEGYFGASSLDPVIIGNRILFTGSKGSVVRDMGYDISSEAYIAVDLTLYAEHLFKSRTIKEWGYAQDPDGIVWCVGSDGVLLGLTYLKEQQVAGWHRHETDGAFESVAVVPGSDRDQVWFVVNRSVNGAIKRYVELLAARATAAVEAVNDAGEAVVVYDPAEQYFVDCGLSYSGEAKTVFSGLTHLEGKTVAILADGNVHPARVVADGAVTLDYPAEVVHIGLGYSADLETLNIDFPAQDGTVQTRYKKILRVTVRLEDSRGGWLGTGFNDLYELKMRSNEAYGVPIALYTGDKEMQFNSGPSVKGRLCVRMSEPLPITVLGIVAEVEL